MKTIPYPPEGTDADLFQRLSDYITAFDADWCNRIKPASQEQISKLKEVSKVKELPKSYEVYLAHMGEKDDNIFPLCQWVDSVIEKAIYLNAEDKEGDEGDEELHVFTSENYLPFIRQELCGEWSIDYDEENYFQIVETEWGRYRAIAENFEKFLFQSAYCKYEKHRYLKAFTSNSKRVREATGCLENAFEYVLEAAEKIANQYGLRKLWYSDFNTLIVAGEGASFKIARTDGDAGYGFITGEDKKTVEAILAAFNTLGLRTAWSTGEYDLWSQLSIVARVAMCLVCLEKLITAIESMVSRHPNGRNYANIKQLLEVFLAKAWKLLESNNRADRDSAQKNLSEGIASGFQMRRCIISEEVIQNSESGFLGFMSAIDSDSNVNDSDKILANMVIHCIRYVVCNTVVTPQGMEWLNSEDGTQTVFDFVYAATKQFLPSKESNRIRNLEYRLYCRFKFDQENPDAKTDCYGIHISKEVIYSQFNHWVCS